MAPEVQLRAAAASELAVSSAPNPFNPEGGVRLATTATTTPATAVVTPDTDEAEPATPIDTLLKQMETMGVSSSGLQMAESRTIVGYPGGSYENHLITVDFGGGVQERYDVGLMLQNPWLTALEIDRLRKVST